MYLVLVDAMDRSLKAKKIIVTLTYTPPSINIFHYLENDWIKKTEIQKRWLTAWNWFFQNLYLFIKAIRVRVKIAAIVNVDTFLSFFTREPFPINCNICFWPWRGVYLSTCGIHGVIFKSHVLAYVTFVWAALGKTTNSRFSPV